MSDLTIMLLPIPVGLVVVALATLLRWMFFLGFAGAVTFSALSLLALAFDGIVDLEDL